MRTALLRGGVVGILLALLAPLSGCHSADTAATAQTPKPAPTTSAPLGRKAAVGATPDMNDYAAPSGVRTGVLPGGQK